MKFFKKREQDLDDEIRSHLRMAEEDRGAQAARREFGNVGRIMEATREMWSWNSLESTVRDLRYGLRMMRRTPALSAVSILMLAVGIGVTTTVFCWFHTIAGKPLRGVREPASLIAIAPSYGATVRYADMAYPDYAALANLHEVFSGAVASEYTSALLRVDERNDWMFGRLATANIFDVLGVKAELGRTFLPEEDYGEGAHPVLEISHTLWQARFGGRKDIVGLDVELNRQKFKIVGVLPPDFEGLGGGLRVDFWAPLVMHREILNFGSFDSHSFRWVTTMARLNPGVSVAQAQAAVDVLSQQLVKAYPESNKDVRYRVVELAKSPDGGLMVLLPALRILLAVSLGVLLIVVVNVANLLLARGISRSGELTVRLAIGAGRFRLIRQLLTECMLLAAFGAGLGIIVAWKAVKFLAYFAPATNGRFDYDFQLDAVTLTFTVLLTAGITLVFGAVPALLAGSTDLMTGLKSSGRALPAGFAGEGLRRALIVIEVALASLLLVGGGLSMQGFERARGLDLGFDPNHLVATQLTLIPSGYTAERGKIFDRQIRERMAAIAGVEQVGLTSLLPLGMGNLFAAPVDVEGHIAGPNEDRMASFVMVSTGYFAAMRYPILEGRDFTDQDDTLGFNAAVVNEVMAKRFWPGASPVGRRFRMAAGVAPVDTFTVIGVVGAGKYRSLAEAPAPLLYLNYLQRPLASLFMSVVLRSGASPAQIGPILRREIQRLDPGVEPAAVETMEEHIRPAFEPVRVAASAMSGLSAMALLLASIGVYGVMAYLVGRRFQEIGVRMALGAKPADVLWLMLGQGMRLVALGMAAGLGAALSLTHLLGSVLYGVNASDPATFASVAAILGGVTGLACLLPARRALRVDPLVALRQS